MFYARVQSSSKQLSKCTAFFKLSEMDSKACSLSDLDGSSLFSEVDEEFADTFCPNPEDSRLEITRFPDKSTDTNANEKEQKQCEPICFVEQLESLAVRFLNLEDIKYQLTSYTRQNQMCAKYSAYTGGTLLADYILPMNFSSSYYLRTRSFQASGTLFLPFVTNFEILVMWGMPLFHFDTFSLGLKKPQTLVLLVSTDWFPVEISANAM